MRIFVGIPFRPGVHRVQPVVSYLALLHEWLPFLGAMLPGLIFLSAATAMIYRLEEGNGDVRHREYGRQQKAPEGAF